MHCLRVGTFFLFFSYALRAAKFHNVYSWLQLQVRSVLVIFQVKGTKRIGELQQSRACAGHFLQVNMTITSNIVRSQRR